MSGQIESASTEPAQTAQTGQTAQPAEASEPAEPDGGPAVAGPTVVERTVEPLLEPRDARPRLVETLDALRAAIEALAQGTGRVAVDAERASGFGYGHRAFLVQFRREGSGTVLIDPVACPDLSELEAVLASTEAVLHAASQDLPCLAELGYRPRQLFDTEIAGRLLGCPRVGLATMVESMLGLGLEKSHSAADWSTRPLPEEWLRYAALDVEVLVELRDLLAEQLASQGKLEWARQEFAAVLAAPPAPPRADPWRRTSGIHKVRNRRGLAVVRERGGRGSAAEWTGRAGGCRGRRQPQRAAPPARMAACDRSGQSPASPIAPARVRATRRWAAARAPLAGSRSGSRETADSDPRSRRRACR